MPGLNIKIRPSPTTMDAGRGISFPIQNNEDMFTWPLSTYTDDGKSFKPGLLQHTLMMACHSNLVSCSIH